MLYIIIILSIVFIFGLVLVIKKIEENKETDLPKNKSEDNKSEKVQDKTLLENFKNKYAIILFFIDNFINIFLLDMWFVRSFTILYHDENINMSDFITKHFEDFEKMKRNLHIEMMAYNMSNVIVAKDISTEEEKIKNLDEDDKSSLLWFYRSISWAQDQVPIFCESQHGYDFSKKYILAFEKYKQIPKSERIHSFKDTIIDITKSLRKKKLIIKSEKKEQLLLHSFLLGMIVYMLPDDIFEWVFSLKDWELDKIYGEILKANRTGDIESLLNAYHFNDKYLDKIEERSVQRLSDVVSDKEVKI